MKSLTSTIQIYYPLNTSSWRYSWLEETKYGPKPHPHRSSGTWGSETLFFSNSKRCRASLCFLQSRSASAEQGVKQSSKEYEAIGSCQGLSSQASCNVILNPAAEESWKSWVQSLPLQAIMCHYILSVLLIDVKRRALQLCRHTQAIITMEKIFSFFPFMPPDWTPIEVESAQRGLNSLIKICSIDGFCFGSLVDDKTAAFTREHNPHFLTNFEDHEYISHHAVLVSQL